MIYGIPLQPIATQTFSATLNKQECRIGLYSRRGRLYCDLGVNNVNIWRGVICHDRTPIRNYKSQAFVGNLVFQDSDGIDDPTFDALGSRYNLFYITDDEALPSGFQPRGTEDR